jgi:hypothetical protein
MANSLAGKLIEINSRNPWVSAVYRKVPVDIKHADHLELLNAMIRDDNDGKWRGYVDYLFGLSKSDAEQTYGHYLDRHLSPKATTGAYYLPIHGLQIWECPLLSLDWQHRSLMQFRCIPTA